MTNSFPTRRSSDLAETLPSVQRTAVSVTDQGDGNRPSINADIRADPANALSRLGGDMLQQRHVAAEIATLGHPAAKPPGRRNGDKRAQTRRASCRERVRQYVYISVVAGSIKKNIRLIK